MAQAHTAFRQLRTSASDERSRWLMAIAEAMEEHRSALVAVADEETSLGVGRLNGELDRTIYQFHHFRDAIAQEKHRRAIDQPGDPDASPQPRPSLKQMRVPLGPVAVWGASNFPFAFGVLGGEPHRGRACQSRGLHRLVRGRASPLRHSELATRPDSFLRRDGIGQPCFPHASGGSTARGRDCPGSR